VDKGIDIWDFKWEVAPMKGDDQTINAMVVMIHHHDIAESGHCIILGTSFNLVSSLSDPPQE